ncbi:MAG: hypothetical protein SFV18_04965 [Bryobacteraceae bacterium]|nr:hypothetical protein [Bryobacteraceae bacterium]
MRRLVAWCALLAACGSKPPTIPSRLIVAPVENLAAGLDWAPVALQAMLATNLSTFDVERATTGGDARAALNRVPLYCRIEGAAAKSRLACWLAGRDEVFEASGSGLAPLAAAIVRKVNPAAVAVTIPDEALRAYSERRFADAVAIAPDFGLAYADSGDVELAKRGLARGASIGKEPLARLRFAEASRSRDPKATAEALTALAEFRPSDPALWNQLGYQRAFAKDFTGARAAMAEYAKLSPGANPLDSLGDVNYYAGQFTEAEKHYLAAFEKDAAINRGVSLYKAAFTRLRLKDPAGAQKHWERYLAQIPESERAILAAGWLFVTGKPDEAEKAALAANSAQSLLAASVWARARGDALAARERWMKALGGRVTSAQGLMAAFLAQPAAAPAEWQRRASVQMADPRFEDLRDGLLAAALLFDGHYAAAEAPARRTFGRQQPQSDGAARTMLAWALGGAGKKESARELLSIHPPPVLLSASPLAPVLLKKELELAP